MAHTALYGGTAYEKKGGADLVGGTVYSIDKGKTLVGGTAYEVGFREKMEIVDTWATIASGANISNYALGDWKSIELTDGSTVIMEIVAFNADTKTDGTTAPITWISRGLISEMQMSSPSSNANGWVKSSLRTWLQGDFYATLPNDVKEVIARVNKTYYDKTTASTLSCEDNIWIPSQREMFNSQGETSGAEYTSYFIDDTSRIKSYSNGTDSAWWLRTAYNRNYRRVNYTGTIGSSSSTSTLGVAIGFCT